MHVETLTVVTLARLAARRPGPAALVFVLAWQCSTPAPSPSTEVTEPGLVWVVRAGASPGCGTSSTGRRDTAWQARPRTMGRGGGSLRRGRGPDSRDYTTPDCNEIGYHFTGPPIHRTVGDRPDTGL